MRKIEELGDLSLIRGGGELFVAETIPGVFKVRAKKALIAAAAVQQKAGLPAMHDILGKPNVVTVSAVENIITQLTAVDGVTVHTITGASRTERVVDVFRFPRTLTEIAVLAGCAI